MPKPTMRNDYVAIAMDGDGTLTRGGKLSRKTHAALMQWKLGGGLLFLVTGETPRELDDFPHLELFDRVVAENGALLLGGEFCEERLLCERPPKALLSAFRRAGITSLKRGRLILQAEHADEDAINKVLAQLDIGWSVAHNRDDLIVAPKAISKASGLAAVLQEFKVSPREVVAIGDAQNDGPLLEYCGLGVAVNNAAPQLKRQADIVTRGQYGKGVAEIVEMLLSGKRSQRRKKARRRTSVA